MLNNEYKNPYNQSLKDLFIAVKEDGILRQVPALSEKWITSKICIKYMPLPVADSPIESSIFEEWLNQAECFNFEMERILQLKYHKFWSYLVFDSGSIDSVISFLQESTPFYIPIQTLTNDHRIHEIYLKIMRNILAIICRMITSKESESEWMTKEQLAELLYSKYLLSMPTIFDLIVTYGRSNAVMLTKIIETLFKIEPKYKDDLKMTLKFIQKSFHIIQTKIESDETNEDKKILTDLALHTLDCAATLGVLLEIYPEARDICTEIKLEQSITNFYDGVIPILFKNIYTYDAGSKSLNYINQARIELLASFKCIINSYVEKVLKHPGSQSINYVENLLAILTVCLSDYIFVIDYQKIHPIQNDMEILRQACPKMDTFKADFILQAFLSDDESMFHQFKKSATLSNGYSNDGTIELEEEGAAALPENNEKEQLPERSIEDEIQTILDILPHLGVGFIRKLLTRYENPELAIAAILEGNLPPDLENADQSEPYIPQDKQDTFFLETGVRHLNIYDGDDYDIKNEDKPKGIIKSGKGFPGQPKNMKALLDDKTLINQMKSRYEEYSMVRDDDYDDEYDDSYDALAESESKTARALNVAKNVLVDEVEDENESEEEDEITKGTSESLRNTGNDIYENPEVIRARYEQMRQQKFGGRSTRDVIGKARGQGQSDNVVHNRHHKDINKASRANHNRKRGSTFKRSRGMIPS